MEHGGTPSTSIPDAPASQDSRSDAIQGVRRVELAIGVAAILLAVVVTFLPILDQPFLSYDDVRLHPELSRITEGLGPGSVAWALRADLLANWIPLTTLSHLVDFELYGDHPRGHYLTNLFLHAAAAAVFFVFWAVTTGRPWLSLLVAVLWSLHPLRVESVAWLAMRKDVLSGLLAALALLAWAHYARRPSPMRYLLVVVLLTLGLASKPMLVTLSLVFLLVDLWPLGRWRLDGWRRGAARGALLLAEKLPLLAVCALFSAVTLRFQEESLAAPLSLDWRLSNAITAVASYLRSTVWPADLAVIYHLEAHPPPGLRVALASALVAGATLGAFLGVRRRPYLLVGWLWFLGTLVPVSGLVQVGFQARADRYTYLPSIGLVVAAVWLAAELASRLHRRRRLLLGALSAAIFTLAAAASSRAQLRHWQSDEDLFRRAVTVSRFNPVAHAGLGRALVRQGRLEEGTHHLVHALRQAPGRGDYYGDVAHAFALQGLHDDAIAVLRKGTEVAPGLSRLHRHLGMLLLEEGEPGQALLPLARAVSLAPDDAAVTALVTALRGTAPAEGRRALERARELHPGGAGSALLAWLVEGSLRAPPPPNDEARRDG
jgi:protein O-mannosyl-transferase